MVSPNKYKSVSCKPTPAKKRFLTRNFGHSILKVKDGTMKVNLKNAP